MKWTIVLGLVLAAAITPSGATTADVVLTRSADLSWFGPMGDGFVNFTTIVSVDELGNPAFDATALGEIGCDGCGGVYASYSRQTVSPTAFQMDAAGNTATLQACLLPDGGGACHTFSIRLSQPAATVPEHTPPNAWVDPVAQQAHADTSAKVSRHGYQASGTAGLVGIPSVGDYSTYQGVRATATADP